ncbi:hypothetical protein SEA_UZUMAKI_41 [Arthrobacter phage Uzumaki]|nr:hypothetical protein SEA_ZEINA_44 [Arthrobacter phage Zeina]UVK62863.1 hypothetical protein SEA_UZUMAKI_41 [Arthrobacter phage Uzumaki]
MAKIQEVEIPVKIYARICKGHHELAPRWALKDIQDKIEEAIEKAINENAAVVNGYGVPEWELLGVNVTVEM